MEVLFVLFTSSFLDEMTLHADGLDFVYLGKSFCEPPALAAGPLFSNDSFLLALRKQSRVSRS